MSDPEKKQIYDDYGEDALKEGGSGSGGGNPFDIFEQARIKRGAREGEGARGQRRQPLGGVDGRFHATFAVTTHR